MGHWALQIRHSDFRWMVGLMAYYYIAETNVAYLVRGKPQKLAIGALRVIMLAVIAYGALRTANLAWALGDLGVGIMAWLNIIAIIWLRKPALDSLKDYEQQLKKAGSPTFDPVKLKIKNAEFWSAKSGVDKAGGQPLG